MKDKFSPSINIKRDMSNDYLYIPTRNSISAYNTIASNFKSGIHSYNIIGSYGTGKSAFLVAFSKHLNKQEEYFNPVNGQFNGCSKFKFIHVVGQYESLIQSLSRELKVESEEDVVYEAIKDYQNKLKKNKECLVLIIDEFGKTLEYSAKNNPEKELYFIQKLAEYANDSRRNFLFLTTLHQNFDAYAIGLNDKDRKEWEKVKGRIKELPFNEPVEQLLNLASQALSDSYTRSKTKALTKKLLKIIKSSNLFKLRNELTDELLNQLFPLEALSSACLLLALQKYGQNERSLFSFIASKEPYGLVQHQKANKEQYYSIADVFDYLVFNYSYLLQSKNNPDFFKWKVVFTALDRVETLIDNDTELAKQLVKVIGTLDLLNQSGGKISSEFLSQYFKEVLNLKEIQRSIELLESKGIIKYHKFRNSYALYEGTDIDIEFEISNKRKQIGKILSVEEEIRKHIHLDFVVAKAAAYKNGTPRIFEYKITNDPIVKITKERSEIDGIINIILTKKQRGLSNGISDSEAIAYCFVNQNDQFIENLTDINVVDRILIENTLDKVARSELVEYKDSLIRSFKESFSNQLFSSSSIWYINGIRVTFESERALNKQLSALVDKIYTNTPIFKNELINRSKISGSIHHAKRLYISALISSWNKADLGFTDNKFPAERMIYRSLLKETGIHKSDVLKGTAEFVQPTNQSFMPLWDFCESFINDSKKGKRSILELIDNLRQKPFKLKDGLIEFWLISFLFIKRDEYALYMDGVYLPSFTTEVAELIFKKPNSFVIKGIEVDGVRLSLFNKYRTLVNQEVSDKIMNKGFQEIARPFLVFYKQLSPYAKHTEKYLNEETIKLRTTLLNAKELEKTFFEDLPKCFGYSIHDLDKDNEALQSFADTLQNSIRELRLQDTSLADRYLEFINNYITDDKIDFEILRSKLRERYPISIEKMLSNRQKSVVRRIHSEIPEEALWLSSLSQAVIGKALNKMNDEDEQILHNSTAVILNELDAFAELNSLNVDSDKELAIRYEIQASDHSTAFNQTIVLKKKQLKEINKLEKEVDTLLEGRDGDIRKGLLLKMLKDM